MIQVTLYSRKECHLCDQVQQELAALQTEYPHKLEILNIDTNPELKKIYDNDVPFVKIGPYSLKAPITAQELQITLAAAIDREKHIKSAENSPALALARQGTVWNKSDSFTYWLSKHWLGVFNTVVALYVLIPFLAPALMKVGATGTASVIYKVYGGVCHQLAYRSFFLFGEQVIYPRAAAHIAGIIPFEQATGLSEGSNPSDILAARQYVGNPTIGYKIALCERDVAIYGSIVLFGLIYSATGRRLRGLPWYLWLLFGVFPIALDGFSQLFSQPPINLGLFRESTPFLRVLTGSLFGFTTAWLTYPLVENSMRDTRRIMEDKLRWMREAKNEAQEKSGIRST